MPSGRRELCVFLSPAFALTWSPDAVIHRWATWLENSLLCPFAPRAVSQSLSHPVALDEFETHNVLQLPEANWAWLQGPQQCFVQAQRALHDALQPSAVPQANQVADLMTCNLSGKQSRFVVNKTKPTTSLTTTSPLSTHPHAGR